MATVHQVPDPLSSLACEWVRKQAHQTLRRYSIGQNPNAKSTDPEIWIGDAEYLGKVAAKKWRILVEPSPECVASSISGLEVDALSLNIEVYSDRFGGSPVRSILASSEQTSVLVHRD